jgi:hypothetical protein
MKIASQALIAVIASALAGCAAEDPETSVETTSQRSVFSHPRDLEAQVRHLSDLQELRGIIDCYGTGHDLIFQDLGGSHREALDVLRRCHVEDLITNVFLFDESKPAQRLDSLTAFVGFVDGFAQQNGYSSARNVPGNVQIVFTDPGTARISSSTVAPHFLTNGPPTPSDRPTLDLVQARYVDTAKRAPDGTWRTVARDLFVQQIWRGEGAYPFATP